MVKDLSYFPRLIPECNTSYLILKGVQPPSEEVVLAFAAMRASLLIQDNNEAVCNMYSTRAYAALNKALKGKFVGAKNKTRMAYQRVIKAWVASTFSASMFAADSENLVVAYEKKGSNYMLAVKLRYQDNIYTFLVSSKMDIEYTMGKLFLLPLFKTDGVKNVFFSVFDS